MKKRRIIGLMLVLILLLSACSSKEKPADQTSGGNTISDEEMGELVRSIDIITSLPSQDMVNHEMVKQVVDDLQNLGVDASMTPTDFAVIIDTLYGEDMDYDAYTIGWSGRLERLDPDMFIHSINHSDNAVAGGYAIVAGLFLQEFVDETPWLHIDIGGTALTSKDLDYCPKGALGFGSGLLYNAVKILSHK